MLREITDLAIETDGRYATDSELSFIDDYANSLSERIDIYEKVKDVEKEVIKQMEDGLYEKNLDVFANNSSGSKALCRRDAKLVLRYCAAAMLTDDYDRLRESFLLWQRTIMLAFKMEECTQIMYSELLPKILASLLTEEEYRLMEPALQLNESVLAY